MDEATLARVIEPFFTTKGVGRGTGLGLAMVDGLVAQSGGKLVIHSKLGEGTQVELWVPAAADQSAVLTPEDTLLNPIGSVHILLVDDDPLVLTNATALLEDLGHKVTATKSADDGQELLARGIAFDIVISDYAMPGMNGADLAAHVRSEYPTMHFVLASGFADVPVLPVGVTRIAKPYSQIDLRRVLSEKLGGQTVCVTTD